MERVNVALFWYWYDIMLKPLSHCGVPAGVCMTYNDKKRTLHEHKKRIKNLPDTLASVPASPVIPRAPHIFWWGPNYQ